MTSTHPAAALIAGLALALGGCTQLQLPDLYPGGGQAPAPKVAEKPPVRPFPPETLYALLAAEMAGQRKMYDVALANYLAQAHRTRDPGVAARAARLAQLLRVESAALDAYTLWAEIAPANPEARFNAALLLAAAGRQQEAFGHMQAVLRLGGSANFSALAASALRLPEEQQAQLLEQYERLLAEQPEDPQLLLGKAILLQQRGDKRGAVELARQVIERDPQNLQAVVVEAKLLQELDEGPDSYKRINAMLEQDPANARLRLQYARMLAAHDLPAAQEQFATLVKQSPDDPELVFSLAILSKETGKPLEAQYQFERLLKMGERSSTAHYFLGTLAEERGDAIAAAEHYRQVPPGADFMAATTRLVNLLADTGNLEEARATLAEYRDLYPMESTRLLLLESDLLVDKQFYAAAHRLLSNALMEDAANTALLYARAMVSEKRSNIGAAEQDLRKLLELDPQNANAMNALGYILADRTTRLDEAGALLERANTLKPGDGAILDSLGWLNFRRGDYPKAVLYLEEAWDRLRDPEVAAHLGEALWKAGNKERAERIWKRGQRIGREHELLRSTVKRYLGREYVKDAK